MVQAGAPQDTAPVRKDGLVDGIHLTARRPRQVGIMPPPFGSTRMLSPLRLALMAESTLAVGSLHCALSVPQIKSSRASAISGRIPAFTAFGCIRPDPFDIFRAEPDVRIIDQDMALRAIGLGFCHGENGFHPPGGIIRG